MHMWFWFGYNIGDFLFSGLTISTRWAFALTWIALFFVALLFEGSKVYLAKVQREAHRKLYPYRSDERRNLLCDREQGAMEPTTSRNASSGQVTRWTSVKMRTLVNTHQSLVFVVHNLVGYLLMLAVMIYNVHLLLAVVFGMMLGYFLFGPKLTRMQMKCFSTKRAVICTPECDDTAETSTPPLLDSSTESDLFICQTRTCIQPSYYFPAATTSQGVSNELANATCYYGAKNCPSKVAKVKKAQRLEKNCRHAESEKEDNPSVEDVQLLRTERQGCCKKKQEPPPEEKKCCKNSSHVEAVVHESSESKCCKKEEESEQEQFEEVQVRENSPQIMCCHSTSVPHDSQEQIIQ